MEHIKTKKQPSGVVVDASSISLSSNRLYRELNEFEKTNQVLGKGNSSLGDIIVLKDIKTGKELAQKTIMISEFRCDEVRCWVALNESGYVPHIYMFRIVNNRVEIHMEILKHAKTLNSIINEHMTTIRQPENIRLVKPFSLYVLDGAIEAISCMYKHDFTHNDMHSGNVMLDSKLKVKIIDFGTACRIRDSDAVTQTKNVKKDIGNVLRIFSGLYTTQEYTSVQDLQDTYHEIKQTEGYMGLSEADRSELFNLIDVALTITHPNDLEWYRMMVKYSLENALPDSELTVDQIRMDVVALLFPEILPMPSPNLGQVGSTNKDDDKANVAGGLTALSNSELRADPLREKAAALRFPETSQTVYMNQDTAGVADGSTAAGAADSVIEELRKQFGITVVQ
ncbi:uncharacterized protein LOC127851088 isoform X2 [Dreissena polymorpha]|uniref:uncharacterized protein LOC127851088 isoform X2 n=1 Tax=Dreissena polymorpha TaxID=45954 RepID=UPI00226528AC|nr:uncharacterized protein LOC127851088 isoform X2 [Dreissena polymorpha]